MPHTYTNVDLHCHSTYSDGTLAPDALAQLARQGGVDLWALTDHDEIAGQSEACKAAHAQGIDYLTGVEISASFAGHTIHVVGLGFDTRNTTLRDGLHSLRHSRGPRAEEMGKALERAGIPGAYEGALQYAGNPDLVSRTHFARFLMEQGICQSMHEVFSRFLVEGKPGFVPQKWASVQEAVTWVVQAGGVAVIAHPAAYALDHMLEDALLQTFKDSGGVGIEVVCGGHNAAETARYAEVAAHYGLLASRGSDFHSPQESRWSLGSMGPLPHRLHGVWEHLQDRILRAPAISA